MRRAEERRARKSVRSTNNRFSRTIYSNSSQVSLWPALPWYKVGPRLRESYRPLAAGQEFTQPRAHLIAQLCTFYLHDEGEKFSICHHDQRGEVQFLFYMEKC